MMSIRRVISAMICSILLGMSSSAIALEPARFPSLISSIRIQSPIDFCGEAVPLDIADVRERLEKELLLTLANRPQVILWIKRANRYLPLIEAMLAEAEMPMDLKYIAVIESALRPHVASPKRAVGFWQFMPETGRNFGLRVNAQFDDRRNVFHSTRAAIRYLHKLYQDFGSWSLAAAAYNMGEEGLKTEMIVQQETDYFRLYLPLETQRYVFRALSAKLILSDFQKYGFTLTNSDLYPPLSFDRVGFRCLQRTPIQIIAQAAGTYFKIIKDLNPEIRGHFLAEGEHTLLIPKGAGIDFQVRFEMSYQAWVQQHNETTYVVQQGDNLSLIAQKFDVPLTALLLWNRIKPHTPIHPGDELVIYRPVDSPRRLQTQ